MKAIADYSFAWSTLDITYCLYSLISQLCLGQRSHVSMFSKTFCYYSYWWIRVTIGRDVNSAYSCCVIPLIIRWTALATVDGRATVSPESCWESGIELPKCQAMLTLSLTLKWITAYPYSVNCYGCWFVGNEATFSVTSSHENETICL